MKKMMVLLIAFLMFVGVKVEALEVNKITVEGKEIELKEHTHIFSHIQWNMKGTMLFVEQKTDHFYSIDEIEEKYAIPSAFVPFYTQVKQIIERELV